MEVSIKEINCLREHIKQATEILNRLGFGLDGGTAKRTAVKKEPAKKERLRNWDEVLSLGKKNSKPKHLQK